MQTPIASARRKIVLDVDTGVDDALAIILAHRDPQVDVVAIGTVSGNVLAHQAAINTLKTLDVLGAVTPVAVGCSHPLTGQLNTAEEIHGHDGLGDTNLAAPSRAITPEYAPSQLVRLANMYPGELTIFASGPLTNVAVALLLDPLLPAKVKEIVLMGGAITHPGNISAVAEVNIYNDPEAASIVFAASWPVTMVSLDVTMLALLKGSELDAVRQSEQPLARFFASIMGTYVGVYSHRLGFDACAPHDALAMAILLDPTIAVTNIPAKVDIEKGQGPARGMTVCDRRVHTNLTVSPPRNQVQIPISVNSEKFINLVMSALLT